MVTASRYHDICAGHRVVGHEGKCRHLHGHNYRFNFDCVGDLDSVGRVIDFSVIKSTLCEWLENEYDHKMLIWSEDPMLESLRAIDKSIVEVGFNPTAENIAKDFVDNIAPALLKGTGAKLVKCTLEETRKCKASYEINS